MPKELNFTQSTTLPEHQRIDHCFAGLHGPMTIKWPDANVTLTLRCSEQMNHAILYNPPGTFFAVEPVSHANDAVNLVQQGIDAGIQTLAPGDSWQDSLVMELT